MSIPTAWLLDRYYCSKPDFVDGTAHFFGMCRDHVVPGSRILEVGAGPTNRCSEFFASLGPVTGVDVSDEVLGNRALSSAAVYDGLTLPFDDAVFDACISNYVLEHVEHPARHFQEVARVLKPGGVYCVRTPNLRHYVTAGAKLLPHRMHLKIANRLRALDATAHDPYPTFYRANTPGRIRKLAAPSGLEVRDLQMIEKEPSYGLASPLLFVPMMVYERLVNSWSALAVFRVNIFTVLVNASPGRSADSSCCPVEGNLIEPSGNESRTS